MPQLLPIKVPRNACYHDANAEDAPPERRGAGDKEHPGRSRQSPHDGSRLLDLLPGNHDDLFPCMSGLAQGIKRSLSPGPCLTDAIGVVGSASALIGGIASQFGREWPKVAAKMPAFEQRVEHAAPQVSRAHVSDDNAASRALTTKTRSTLGSSGRSAFPVHPWKGATGLKRARDYPR
jgi:hypothetical protein